MGIGRNDHGEGEGGSQHQLESLELKALLARGNNSLTYMCCLAPSKVHFNDKKQKFEFGIFKRELNGIMLM